MLEAHGSKLISRIPSSAEKTEWQEYALFLRKITVDRTAELDLYSIATGAYSPLTGFLGREEYLNVLQNCELKSGIPWTIPITLGISREDAGHLNRGDDVTLRNKNGENLAVLKVDDIYAADRELESERMYTGYDLSHPGIVQLYERSDLLIAGSIIYIAPLRKMDYSHTPAETRRFFEELGWKSVLALPSHQPENLFLLGHADGLFLNPLLDLNDDPEEVRIRCYEILLQHSYPADRTFLSVLPAAQRHAGIRETVHHAIMQKNFGATHVLVEDEKSEELLESLATGISVVRNRSLNRHTSDFRSTIKAVTAG